MDIRSLSSKYGGYSIDQYCPPTNYELAGKESSSNGRRVDYASRHR
jgi:hypothetical protein